MGIFDLKAEYNRNRIIKEQDTLENELSALRARLAECERVAEEQARALIRWQEHSGWCMFCDTECDDDFIIYHEDDCEYDKIVGKYEAYKSSHEVSGEHSPERKD